MSNQPRPSAKVAAKRRAEIRRRNREMIRRILAIFFVVIFVLGTATTIFIFQGDTTTAVPGQPVAANNVPAATVPPAGSSVSLTPGAEATPKSVDVSSILQQAEAAGAAGKWDDAVKYYKSALGLTVGNATIHYDLGKAYIQTKDYTAAVDQLQQAVTLNPEAAFAADAKNLIAQYQGQAAPASGTLPATTTTPSTK